jgi:hypothetical protein
MNHQTGYRCSFHHHDNFWIEYLLWNLRERGYEEVRSNPARMQYSIRRQIYVCNAAFRRKAKPCMWKGTKEVKSCPKCGKRRIRVETQVDWVETVSWGRAQAEPHDTRVRKGEPARRRPPAEETMPAGYPMDLNELPEEWAALFERLEAGDSARMVIPLC